MDGQPEQVWPAGDVPLEFDVDRLLGLEVALDLGASDPDLVVVVPDEEGSDEAMICLRDSERRPVREHQINVLKLVSLGDKAGHLLGSMKLLQSISRLSVP